MINKLLKYVFVVFIVCFMNLFTTTHLTTKTEALASSAIHNIDSNSFMKLLNENKGKLILVNFFASWCPPCVEEIPDFVEITKNHPKEDIMIIGLSVDQDPKALEDFIKKHKINYPVFYASQNLVKTYKVYSIPQNIVYNKKLKAIYNEVGIISYEQIEEMLKDS